MVKDVFIRDLDLPRPDIELGARGAVLLGATLIRGVLLPASMKLLGDWNWWLPGSMSWTAQVQHHGESEVTPARRLTDTDTRSNRRRPRRRRRRSS